MNDLDQTKLKASGGLAAIGLILFVAGLALPYGGFGFAIFIIGLFALVLGGIPLVIKWIDWHLSD